MRILGIEIKGSDCICILIDGSKDNFSVVDFPKKLSVKDSYNSDAIRSFHSEIADLIEGNYVDSVAIKKRTEKGKFAGGALSFKMEGIIQLATDKEVNFISSPQITSLLKKNPTLQLPSLNKYQEQAFYTAFNFLEN